MKNISIISALMLVVKNAKNLFKYFYGDDLLSFIWVFKIGKNILFLLRKKRYWWLYNLKNYFLYSKLCLFLWLWDYISSILLFALISNIFHLIRSQLYYFKKWKYRRQQVQVYTNLIRSITKINRSKMILQI